MKLIIDIPKQWRDDMVWENFDKVDELCQAILDGDIIPDNATVGEVFCMLACKEPICETASYFTIDKELWNSPYQKGGKE